MKIICIACNYEDHVAEFQDVTAVQSTTSSAFLASSMANAPSGVKFFMKPDTALLRNNEPFFVPDWASRFDYECELVVRINRVGRAISRRFAHRYYDEVGLGIDFTARDLQREIIAHGLPWEACKAFDRSAAISSEFLKISELGGDPQALKFEMMLNGEVRQSGWTGDMIFPIDAIIEHVSRFVTLKMGDLIYTGTPCGVGPVQPGDRLTASLEGRELLNFAIK